LFGVEAPAAAAPQPHPALHLLLLLYLRRQQQQALQQLLQQQQALQQLLQQQQALQQRCLTVPAAFRWLTRTASAPATDPAPSFSAHIIEIKTLNPFKLTSKS
jgi:hypothetical protein